MDTREMLTPLNDPDYASTCAQLYFVIVTGSHDVKKPQSPGRTAPATTATKLVETEFRKEEACSV